MDSEVAGKGGLLLVQKVIVRHIINHFEQIVGVMHYGLPTDDVKLRLVPYH